MLLRCIRAESRKLHASPVWLMFLLLPTLSAGYGTFNYLQNLDILSEGWYSLWTQHTLFYSLLFFPALVAVYAAYLWRLEHLGHNWNLLMTAPVPRFGVFFAKFAAVVQLVLLTQGLTFLLYLLCGKVFADLEGWPPVETFWFLMRGVLGGLPVAAAQLLLSMLVRGFAAPVLWALMGGVAGMLAASRGLGLWWPYALMQLGMNSNRSEDLLSGSMGSFVLASLVWLLAFLTAAACLLEKRDVKA